MAIDSKNNVFTIHRFSAEGKLIKSWGEPGTGPGQFNLPHGLALDDSNKVYVADRENERIQVFYIDGNLKSLLSTVKPFSSLKKVTRSIRPDRLSGNGDGEAA